MTFEPAATRVVQNPVSGSRAARARAELVAEALRARGFEVVRTERGEHACALARSAAERGQSGVIVLGGDGTLYEAARDVGPGFALGQFPTGTINLLAAALSVPTADAAFVELVEARAARPIRLARANGRRFLSVGSVGLDAEAVRRVWKPLKRVASRSSYALSTFASLAGYRARHFWVELDGRVVEGGLCGVLFARQPYFAHTRRVTFPGADPAAPELHVLLLRGAGRLANLIQLVRMGAWRWNEASVERVRVHRLRIEADPCAPVELDGDFFGWTPLEVVVEDEPTPFLAR